LILGVSMGGQSADSVGAATAPGKRSARLAVVVAGFVAVFSLASGVGLGALDAAGQLSDDLLVLTLAGLVVFVVAAVVFYRRFVLPVVRLSAGVRALMEGDASAGPLALLGPPEVASLAGDINLLLASVRADFEAKARLAAIVESSVDVIIGKTLDGIITSWNAAAEAEYGYRAQEVIGRSVSVIVPPERAGELAQILDRVRRGERVAQLETKRCCKDGHLVDVSVSVSPVRDAGGAVTGAATVARDISERARLEAERRELEGQLQQAERLESLGQLAGGVAHDFNNLLAVITSYASFVAEQTAGDPAVQADVSQIQGAAERAARITKQLLIIGRRDAQQREVLDLNTIVSGTRDLLTAALGAGIEIRMILGRNLPAIEADRGQVEQVLLNLAVNARDAMPGGGTLTIETGVAGVGYYQGGLGPGRYAELAVSDTGTGMSSDVVAWIFDPFFTTKPVGQGTGLGLATVHAVVTGLGGSISVESEEGSGTAFRVLLPASAAAPQAPAGSAPGQPGARGKGQTVLVVDDEPAVLELAARILRQNGYATLEAGTFEEALSLASAQDMQLLLTDSVMPRMSGTILAERVVTMRPRVRVLYMSGHAEEALGERVAQDRAQFIQKPFTSQELLDKVESALATAPQLPAGAWPAPILAA
jgi:two-component system cell cycle sensor histidine kinase/response regulator CckA